jgi:hypothetical protein
MIRQNSRPITTWSQSIVLCFVYLQIDFTLWLVYCSVWSFLCCIVLSCYVLFIYRLTSRCVLVYCSVWSFLCCIVLLCYFFVFLKFNEALSFSFRLSHKESYDIVILYSWYISFTGYQFWQYKVVPWKTSNLWH